METKLLSLGYGNVVSLKRIKIIIEPDTSPIKRIIAESRERGRIIDATYGRRTKTVIITDSDHVILSSIETEILRKRYREEMP